MMLQNDAKQAIIGELRRRVGSAGEMSGAERLIFRMEMLQKYPFRSKATPDQLIQTWIDNYFIHRLPP